MSVSSFLRQVYVFMFNWTLHLCENDMWNICYLVMSFFSSHHLVCGNIFALLLKCEYLQILSSFVLEVSPLLMCIFLFCLFSLFPVLLDVNKPPLSSIVTAVTVMLCSGIFASKVVQWHRQKMMGTLSYRGCWVQSHSVACLMLIQLA